MAIVVVNRAPSIMRRQCLHCGAILQYEPGDIKIGMRTSVRYIICPDCRSWVYVP